MLVEGSGEVHVEQLLVVDGEGFIYLGGGGGGGQGGSFPPKQSSFPPKEEIDYIITS